MLGYFLSGLRKSQEWHDTFSTTEPNMSYITLLTFVALSLIQRCGHLTHARLYLLLATELID